MADVNAASASRYARIGFTIIPLSIADKIDGASI